MPEPVSIFASHATLPDASGLVSLEPYQTFDAAAVINPLVWRFQDQSLKVGVNVQFTVPQDYLSAPRLRVFWTSVAVTGDVIFDWSVLPRTVGEDMGAAPIRTTETVTDTKGGTAFVSELSTIVLTDADYSPGDIVLATLFRDALNVLDTMTENLLVFDALFDYS